MLLTTALGYRRLGLQVVPALVGKRPAGNWRDLQKELLSEPELIQRFDTTVNPHIIGLGLLCGAVSGGLEVVDVDSKYDLTGTLYTEFKRLIDDNLPEVTDKLVIAQTKSGGYHIYYRAEDIAGNQKLARRPTSAEELAANPHERIKVLLETRGEGGFIVTPPTDGYSFIQNDFTSIPFLTTDQRLCLLSIARSFNEEPDVEPVRPQEQKAKRTGEGLSPFDDYNQRGDIIGLLEGHGWRFVNRQGQRINLKRPGDSPTKTSGNFHEGLRKLLVFSSSTEFLPQKAYSPTDVFILLECNGDKSDAARRLKEMGYGINEPIRTHKTRVKADRINVSVSNENGEDQPIDKDGTLDQESIRAAKGTNIYVYFTQDTPRHEIIGSIDLIERTKQAKVYTVEVASLLDKSNPIETYRSYEFRAFDIIKRYQETYLINNGYVSVEQEDEFIDEFLVLGQKLKDPIDRGRLKELFLEFSSENKLGITEKTLDAKTEQLEYNQQKEKQNEAISQLLETTKEHQAKGDYKKAIEELGTRTREIATIAQADEFVKMLVPVKEVDLATRLKLNPTDVPAGFIIQDEPLLIPSGAITVVAAPTSHGKTTFMANLALNMSKELIDKSIYFLTYEESADAVLISTMSIFIGEELSGNSRKSIQSFYRSDSNEYTKYDKRPLFEQGREQFFSELITPRRLVVQYVNYDADALMQAILYLHKYGNAGAVLIDYMQLLHKGGEEKFQSRQLELQRICNDLKDVAVETGIPIVVGAQFNREVVNPARMHSTKIREAADIEQIANLVLGMWNTNFKMFAGEDEAMALENYKPGRYQLYIEKLKHRTGVAGLTGMLDFNGNTGVIANQLVHAF